MKHLYLLLFLTIFVPLFASAQSNYKPGYVVTLNGDTLHGYINYREWDKNPASITFKKDLNNTGEDFTTKNTSAFGVTGYEFFKRSKVRISQGQVETSNLKLGVDSSYSTADVFLRILSTGSNVSLFSYTDDIKTRFYILDHAGNQPQELIYRVYYNGQNANYYQTDDIYQNQLQSLIQKYNVYNDKLQIQLSASHYTESDILTIVFAINGNNGKQFTPKSRVGTRLFAGLGITDNNLTFSGTINYPARNSIFPKASAGIDVIPNKNTQALFFRAELSFTAAQFAFPQKFDAVDNSSYSISSFTQSTVAISPQIAYSFYNSEQLKVFIDAGISVNISSYSSFHFTQIYTPQLTTTQNGFPNFLHVWTSFPVKAGVQLNKKLEIYAGYTIETNLTANNPGISGDITTYQAGVNYLFGIK